MHAPLIVSPAELAKRQAKRRTVAKRLLRREKKIANDLLLIDGDKDALRTLSQEADEGFTVEIEGLGSVQVKAAIEAELTGIRPQLVVAAFLGLPKESQEEHVKDGLVEIVEVWKNAAKPSVTVRL